jgi:hypothetical protein
MTAVGSLYIQCVGTLARWYEVCPLDSLHNVLNLGEGKLPLDTSSGLIILQTHFVVTRTAMEEIKKNCFRKHTTTICFLSKPLLHPDIQMLTTSVTTSGL